MAYVYLPQKHSQGTGVFRMNLFAYIDSYEKALVFWFSFVGLGFASIVIGLKLGNFLNNLSTSIV
tara:strand:- start:166 stop:360 length:195 start_codon:yes stop_codon:yes gene_type:complete